jgi:5-(carboxyamino)imidazole ribonucleotide synthase
MLKNSAPIVVGIVGSGQLSRMIYQSFRGGVAAHANCDVLVMADAASSSAERAGARVMVIERPDAQNVRRFLERCSVVTFENEFVDTALFTSAAQDLNCAFRPDLSVLSLVQDKLSQKKLFRELGLAQSDWVVIDPGAPFSISDLEHRFPEGYVLKWARFGYDGKGVLLVGAGPAAPQRQDQQAFVASAHQRGLPVYAESKIAFKSELAMVAVRRSTGQFVFYPLVVTRQENGICKTVRGPATSLGVTPAVEALAQRWMRLVGDHLQMVGAFALEFFLTTGGELLVNEMAPRVHNSGHFSMDACQASQFENHARAVVGLDLAEPSPKFAFYGMVNLIGVERPSKGALERCADTALHWYDKGEVRAGRKMGHVNVWATSSAQLEARLRDLEAIGENEV